MDDALNERYEQPTDKPRQSVGASGEKSGRPASSDERSGRVTARTLFRWRGRLMLSSRPTHLLGGVVPAPFHDVPRRPLLPPDIDDPKAAERE